PLCIILVKKFDFNNTPPFYSEWDENISEFYSREFENIFIILNPFIELKGNYDRNNEYHNIWFNDQTMDYPTSKYIVNFCNELKWEEVIKKSKLNTISEINHALINYGLKKEFQNRKLADKLYEFCNQEKIFYPPDGEFTPFNIAKIIKLLNELNIEKIELTSEFGDYKTELKTKELSILFSEHNYNSPSIISIDKSLMLVNHWDSYVTVLATNKKLSRGKLTSFGFEVKNTNEFPRLNYRT
ncbi:DUF2711 family protein, partial [Luteirhabdus pelagi]|uniref:DUF2711 family protein n=1 Tax=Luteirhabdus pelagi TaxID=2792783 RepID=UPI001F21431B